MGDEVTVLFSQGGSTDRLMATDQLGRNVSSRVIRGARISVIVAAVILGNEEPLALCWSWRRWYGGLVDEVTMRLVDIKSSFPLILIALIPVITLGQALDIIVAVLDYIIPPPTLFNPEYRLNRPLPDYRPKLARTNQGRIRYIITTTGWGLGRGGGGESNSA